MDRIISVTGTGVSTAPPDSVMISGEFFGIFSDYGEAVRASAEAVTGLRKVMGEAGFDMDDLRTTRISVDPMYRTDGEARVFEGYRFVHGITITEPLDGESLGRLMEALVSCEGAPEFRISYFLKDASEAESRARRAAVEDARCKAKELAAAAGVSLGDIVSISYGPQAQCPPAFGARLMMNVDAVPEDSVYTDTVAVSWRIV